MKKFLGNRDGATAVEFALAIWPVLLFIFGIFQTGYILWIDNMLHYSVDAAARCGAVGSSTYPCFGSGFTNMQCAADALFRPVPGAPTFTPPSCPPATTPNVTFTANCSSSGLTGTYHVSVLSIVDLTLTAKSCYP